MDGWWQGFWIGTANTAFMLLVAIPWALRTAETEEAGCNGQT